MLTPFRSAHPELNSSDAVDAERMVLTLNTPQTIIEVSHDGFSIGTSQHCDLTLEDSSLASLHSLIHLQHGAIWIETANDDGILLVNDRPYRRMALRHQDRLKIGSAEFTVLMQPVGIAFAKPMEVAEDLSLLTAEELCDRIVADQAMVNEFVSTQRSGWEALMNAIEEAGDHSDHNELIEQPVQRPVDEQAALTTLLDEIQELNETITGRTRELSECEAEVLQSTTLLEESQQQVAQRIEELMDQLNQDPPNELRASA